VAFLVLLPGGATWAQGRSPRYIDPTPINFQEHAGWQSMFDGKSLKAWDGPTDVWRTEAGEIVARSTAANPTGTTYLIWGDGQPGNFEFKAEIKLDGQGSNSGIQFRATKLGRVADKKYSKWVLLSAPRYLPNSVEAGRDLR
jgi:hypothetical protein